MNVRSRVIAVLLVVPLLLPSVFARAGTSEGGVFGWGDNKFGQLGRGNTSQATESATGVVKLGAAVTVAAGGYHSLALMPDGSVWSWGNNDYGQLGDGTLEPHFAPRRIIGLQHVIAISAGLVDSLAVTADGTVWGWGATIYGQLGGPDGVANQVAEPFMPRPLPVQGISNAIAVASGFYHSLALRSDGTVWAWGDNQSGQVGVDCSVACNGTPTPLQVQGISNVVSIAAGSLHSLAVDRDGTLWTWGLGSYGALGDGRLRDEYHPVKALIDEPVVQAAAGIGHSIALGTDGRVFTWGFNRYGQLGDGTINDSPFPSAVAHLSNAKGVAAGMWSSFAYSNDHVYAWGDDYYEELGPRDSVDSRTPAPLSVPQGAIAVGGSGYHMLAFAPTIPSAPRLLAATPSPSGVELQWSAPTWTPPTTAYRIYRRKTETTFTAVAETLAPTYIDTSCGTGVCTYYVTAFSMAGESGRSNRAVGVGPPAA